MPGFIGLPEIMLLGLVALLLFGPKRLPELGRSFGKGLREFKDSVTGDGKSVDLDALEIPNEPTVAAAGAAGLHPVAAPAPGPAPAARRDVA